MHVPDSPEPIPRRGCDGTNPSGSFTSSQLIHRQLRQRAMPERCTHFCNFRQKRPQYVFVCALCADSESRDQFQLGERAPPLLSDMSPRILLFELTNQPDDSGMIMPPPNCAIGLITSLVVPFDPYQELCQPSFGCVHAVRTRFVLGAGLDGTRKPQPSPVMSGSYKAFARFRVLHSRSFS